MNNIIFIKERVAGGVTTQFSLDLFY